MLDDLAPHLAGAKGNDLLRRLNDGKRVDQALPAEMELALLWAVSSLGDIEVEPEWWGDERRPDAITDRLVRSATAAIEIAAPNDNSISGEAEMDAIALQIGAAANSAEKGSSQFLYYTFREESGYVDGKYVRRRMTPRGFKVTNEISALVSGWIKSGQSMEERLRIVAPGLDLFVERKSYKQTRFHNVHSSMPAETHSLEDNPLFGLLRRKKRQLKAAARGTYRLIFLADVGSTLLNQIGRSGERYPMGRRVPGSQIIAHFVQQYATDIDAVVVFSPTVERRPFYGGIGPQKSPERWTVTYWGTPALPEPPEALERLAGVLPAPRYEGYQARSLFRQGAFAPHRRGQYLGMNVKGNGKGKHSIEFPARLLIDLLAGRISEEWFRNYISSGGRNPNLFEHWLKMGWTLSGAEMAPRSVDEDDDHLIFHFSDDPAARPFKFSIIPLTHVSSSARYGAWKRAPQLARTFRFASSSSASPTKRPVSITSWRCGSAAPALNARRVRRKPLTTSWRSAAPTFAPTAATT